MKVVAIRKPELKQTQTVEGTQKAIDKLPLNSGTWKVEGLPGLYVRCRAESKSFLIQRRRGGRLAVETLGPIPLKAAKEKAMKQWGALQPRSDADVTLSDAFERFLNEKPLAAKTRSLYQYNLDRYLEALKKRTLEQIGQDRGGLRVLMNEIKRKHGVATVRQCIQLVSSVYRWQRRINPDLPESPTIATPIHALKARDWAYSEDELRAWWHHQVKREGADKPIDKGVSTLGTIKRMWWFTALLTGARKGSIEALKWTDVDLVKKIITFRVTKGDKPYGVPISDKLAELLEAYKKHEDVPPSSDWVFPSDRHDGGHLVGVKNTRECVGPAHRLRHTYRTTLAQIGATPDQARLLLGHSMGGDVSRGYITAPLVIESLRPVTNAVAAYYLKIVPGVAL